MTITLGGLASGIDTQSLIDGLVAAAKQPITQLATRKSQIDAASTTVSQISSKLSALKTAALALTTTTGFASYAATSTDNSVVGSATGAAQVGSYDVTVSQLASTQKTRATASFASSTTALGLTGSFAIQVGTGAAVNVTIAAGDSLGDIASKISASGTRVAASLMNDGSGYRLALQGLDTGASNAFTITETGTSFGFTNYRPAQDAVFEVDDIPMTRASNQVTGAIGGVTLALTKVTTTPATITISSDTGSLKQKINALVSAYNDVVNAGHAAAGFGSATASNPVLQADGAIRTSLHRINDVVTGAVPGATGVYRTLYAIGMSLNNDGTLTFDGAKLDAAMAADPTGVRRLFVTDVSIGATGVMKTLTDAVDKLTTGQGAPIKARLDSLSAQSKRLADSQTEIQTRVDSYQTQLQKQFSAMDQIVGKYKTMANALTGVFAQGSTKSGS